MQRLFLLSWFTIIAFSFVNLFSVNSVFAQNDRDSDIYSVYDSLLQQEYIRDETKQLVIENQTSILDPFKSGNPIALAQELSPVSKETIDDFSSRNSTLFNKFFNISLEFDLALFRSLIGNFRSWILELVRKLNEQSNSTNPIKLSGKFNLKLKVHLVGKELEQIFVSRTQNPAIDNWKVFKEKYPEANGYIKFSQVGFNKQKTEAIVFVAHHCGWLCGAGWYVFLVKENGKWKIEKKLGAWIS